MGSKVFTIAFRVEPDLKHLSRLKGLRGWRLFRHPTRPEFRMEGVSPESEAVGRGVELDYELPAAVRRAARQEIKAFKRLLRDSKVEAVGPETQALGQALALSIELGIDTLVLYGNTRVGADEGYHCLNGRIVEAMLPGVTGAPIHVKGGCLVREFTDGQRKPDEDPNKDPDEDPDDRSGPLDHHLAGMMADMFFGTSDPQRLDLVGLPKVARTYAFIAGSDYEPTPESLSAQARDQFRAVAAQSGSPGARLRSFLRVCDTWLAPACAKSLVQASTRDASRATAGVAACAAALKTLRQVAPRLDGRVDRLLSEVLDHLRAVKREVRSRDKSQALEGQATRLRWQWRALALRLWMSSWSASWPD